MTSYATGAEPGVAAHGSLAVEEQSGSKLQHSDCNPGCGLLPPSNFTPIEAPMILHKTHVNSSISVLHL